MNFKRAIGILAILSFVGNTLFAQVLLPSLNDSPKIISLNGIWKFKYIPSSNLESDAAFYTPGFNVSNWSDIKVPENWELQGFAEPVYKKMNEGTGLYLTHFTVPSDWKNNPVYIAFDGVQSGYTLWVNGKYAGEFASSFNRQTFDISSFIQTGKTNTLAVKVVTRVKGWEFDTNDDWGLSGIFRDVTLFSLSQTHLKDITVKTFVKNSNTSIVVEAVVENTSKKLSKNLKLAGELIDAKGNTLQNIALKMNSQQTDNSLLSFSEHIIIENAQLWSAENPYLYTLRLSLIDKNKKLQQHTEKVGIREISWTDGILKLNGSPIKLKGVNHHDLSPVNGRAITDAELLEDLKLMRSANVNFIRLCHYPPQPRLLEMCDSLGFYLMDEVPYGYGDELLEDESYLPILKQRAKHTIDRDKNHPSVIVWSVGNENPVTEIGLKTGKYVKTLDATRPYCFPQTPTVINNMMKSMPDSIDVLDFHYPQIEELKNLSQTLDRPLIASEFAHALGLDFGTFEKSYEIMYNSPKLAGGAVWGFMDQGILRKSSKQANLENPTIYAWATKDSFYDTGDTQGTDGVLYANRIPQTDYWEMRKVYSPVVALDDTFYYQPGKANYNVRLQNRFDFNNFSVAKCQWELFENREIIDSGELTLNGKPREVITKSIAVTLPEKNKANVYYLKLVFKDNQGYQFYEKVYPLKNSDKNEVFQNLEKERNTKTIKKDNSVSSDFYSFDLLKDQKGIELKNKNGEVLISKGFFARVGRKNTIAQEATLTSKRSKLKHTIPTAFLLTDPLTQLKTFNSKELVMQYNYALDSGKKETVNGDIAFNFANSGKIDVQYNFAADSKMEAVETGVSFIIPASYTNFYWLGKGPYATYPGKEKLSEYGIFQINNEDLYFEGNRQNVDCAMFVNKEGNGFAILAQNANIAVERTKEGIIVSHNAHVSGMFNKYEWPDNLLSFKNTKEISGSFTIIPFTDSSYPNVLKELFGENKKELKPFKPFYHSYDQ